MIIRFQPVFFSKIWGGDAIRRRFGFSVTGDHIGECWGISALPGKETPIIDGPFLGRNLRELWASRRDLFGGHPASDFPLLVKFIDAATDLSVQVHPDDAYARKNGYPFGKAECWMVLGADEGAQIVYGHTAATRQEMEDRIASETIETVLKRVPVHEGDFFNIAPGTIHAIGGGLLILEIQQSSDLTYRLFDYHRLENGHPRELHLADALETLHFPDHVPSTLWETPYFSIDRIDGNRRETASVFGDYLIAVSGTGTVDGEALKAGDFVMATSGSTYDLQGNCSLFRARLK